MFKWQQGRQKTGYDTIKVMELHRPLPMDIYLIRYQQGAYIPPHCDPVRQGQHYRLNITLKYAQRGGVFHCEQLIWRCGRMVLFRSDLAIHQVSQVESGSRYVLSIGWIWPATNKVVER
jgi:hypothetical protein